MEVQKEVPDPLPQLGAARFPGVNDGSPRRRSASTSFWAWVDLPQPSTSKVMKTPFNRPAPLLARRGWAPVLP